MGMKGRQNKEEERRHPVTSLGGRPATGSSLMVLVLVAQPLSHVSLSVAPWTATTRLPCPSPSPRVCLNSCPLGQ